jgi:predicted amidophosphoribosyltransferase
MRRVLALLAPPACVACGAPLARGAHALCAPCRAMLPWLPAPRCSRCALPAPCGTRCPAATAAFARSWAPLAHEGPARALVHALKFRGALPVAETMAAQMLAGAPAWLLAEGAELVPVAAHPGRRRTRGFDHAALLTRALAKRTGLPVRACLRHRGGTARQLGASAAARRLAGRAAIVAREAAPAFAILVDDVHTTGATLDACAVALRAAGSRTVVAVTYVRVL